MSPAEREQTQCTLEMSDIVNACSRDNGRDLTSDETKKFNRFKDRWDELAELRKFPEPSPGLIGGTFGPGGDGLSSRGQSTENIFGKGGECRSGKWSEMQSRAGLAPDDWGGWKNSDEYFEVLMSQRWDPRLQQRAQGTVLGHDGGFLVPNPLAAEIFDTSLEAEIIRPRARNFVMTSETLGIPSWDGPDHSGRQIYGGISANWSGEAQALNTDDVKLRKTVLAARKLAFLGRVPSELMEDAPNFAAEFQRALSGAAGWHLDDGFLNGNGGNEPEGIRNSPALISVAKETGQAADTIVWSNIVKMWARLWPGGQGNAIWVANGNVIPSLYEMNMAIGTAGVPVFLPASQPAATLFGRPILFTEKLPKLGDEGDILLVDPMSYAIGMRVGVSLMISPHVFFDSDELAFRLRTRVDGKSLWDKALTPAEATETISPFIQLAERA